MANPMLSDRIAFRDANWTTVPNEPGVYVIFEGDEVIYVGMSGRNGKGGLRNRLRDHSSGQIVNMFAQYLFLARVQFLTEPRISHPRDAKAACRAYIEERCHFQYKVASSGAEARELERRLKQELNPKLNP
jgi:excinuclease UvrABC nuclease subunit